MQNNSFIIKKNQNLFVRRNYISHTHLIWQDKTETQIFYQKSHMIRREIYQKAKLGHYYRTELMNSEKHRL